MKKNMVKYLLCLLVLVGWGCLSKHPPKQACIEIHHIGISDKSINTLIITTSPAPNEDLFRDMMVVDEDTYAIIERFVENNNSKVSIQGQNAYEYGSFQIVQCLNRESNYVLPDRKRSVIYFKKLFQELNSKGVSQSTEIMIYLNSLLIIEKIK